MKILKKNIKEVFWKESQRAELEFWKKGPDVYSHFSKAYWLKEL